MQNKNELFEKIFILKNLLDKLNKEGILKDNIQFPSICVLGGINSGKSSVLESILNLNFLPIGRYEKVTRCPIEINLHHINSEESYAIFKNTKYNNFSELKEELYKHFSNIAKIIKIDKTPVIINIYSKNYPDLKLIDLPGFKRKIIPFDIPKNTEEYPIQIAKKYIKNPLNILLCVIPATLMNCSFYDEFAIFGLKLASEMSPLSEYPNNLRTLGVVTKIDIMDLYTDVRDLLLNKQIPIELGYIGVINRSRRDLAENILSKEYIIKKERDFFNTTKEYKDLPKNILGNEALIKKISKIYFKLIKDNLLKNINNEKNIKEILDFLEQNSLKDDEIYDINKKNEDNEEKGSSPKTINKYGNLYG